MRITDWLRLGLAMLIVLLQSSVVRVVHADDAPSRPLALAQAEPPLTFSDGFFHPDSWETSVEISGGGTYTATQRTSGGNPDSYRFMSHTLPPVPSGELYVVTVNHIYRSSFYVPVANGKIAALDYSEDGIILSFPYPDAFSTTQPLLEQGGRLFRATKFIRFIAQNSSHQWETKTLNHLVASDFVAVDGSGDHPNFAADADFIYFGYSRTTSRSDTLPPVPNDQPLVIDQGVDNWQVTVYHDNTNQPPDAVDDLYVIDAQDGVSKFNPLVPTVNDIDPDGDSLYIAEVTQPKSATVTNFGIFVNFTTEGGDYVYGFDYTASDGELTDKAQVTVFLDCACTVNCLNVGIRRGMIPAQDGIDLPLIYAVRDYVLRLTPDGQRYIDMYYNSNPEILATIFTNESLRTEAVATVELLQEPLRSLVEGDGSAPITQEQTDALAAFLSHLSAASSSELQAIIAAELARLGPLDDYVGMTVKEAKHAAIGDATYYLPQIYTAPTAAR